MNCTRGMGYGLLKLLGEDWEIGIGVLFDEWGFILRNVVFCEVGFGGWIGFFGVCGGSWGWVVGGGWVIVITLIL